MGASLEPPAIAKVASEAQEAYFQRLHQEAQRVLTTAREARTKGWDPETDVEIVLAEDLAARVEAQVEIPGIAALVRKLTLDLPNREVVAIEAARAVARGDLRAFTDPALAIDKAVRTGLSILTEGILVAPLEGVAKVKLGRNADGTDYVDLYFAGPIRAAGGTAQAMCVLVADLVRRDLGIGRFVATDAEVERFKEEVPAYKRAQHLQYAPSGEEIELIIRSCPVNINGEGTEREEVTGHRDLPRVETNQLRGGAVLVVAEGLTQKAPKIMKHVAKLKLEGWDFLDTFAKKKAPSGPPSDEDGLVDGHVSEVASSDKFIQELIAGRPVFAHPSRPGGFRLRYGRGRTCGIASTAISPVTMHAVDRFLAVGTQMKLERPGKGTIATPCDTLEGPTVLLDDGELRRIDRVEDYQAIASRVRQITDLGEILIPFGEFAENNATLIDASFTLEWWREMVVAKAGEAVAEHLASQPRPSFGEAMAWSRAHGVPLHPAHTFLWHDVPLDRIAELTRRMASEATWDDAGLRWPRNESDKELLVAASVPHREDGGQFLLTDTADAFAASLGLARAGDDVILRPDPPHDIAPFSRERFPTVAWVAANLGVAVKPRAPSRVGARMGRPEKSDIRKMDPAVHALYPLGQAGGITREIAKAALKGPLETELGLRKCTRCGRDGVTNRCLGCGGVTTATDAPVLERKIPLAEELRDALKRLGLSKAPDRVKGVLALMSKHKTPEPLVKGLLRALHDVFPFKDGTIRYDLTDAPITHFRPAEIGTPVAKLRDLGYTHDVRGRPLESGDQLLELRVQDVIPSRHCGQHMVKVARYVDDLLVRVYGLTPFYSVTRPQELVGHLVAGLAPHTSGAVLGRIIGYTEYEVGWAHPFFHTGKRRNCLAPETEVLVANSPSLRRKTLADVFSDAEGDARSVDDAGTVAKDLQRIEVLSANRRTGALEYRRARRILRLPAPANLLEIVTASGRTLRCSPAHRMEVWVDGGLTKKPALAVEPGENLVVARRLPAPVSALRSLDWLDILGPRPPAWVVVRGVRAWLTRAIMAARGLAAAAKAAGVGRKDLDNFRRRDSVPLRSVLALSRTLGWSNDDLPAGLTLAARRDTVATPRRIGVDHAFMRLVGYYLAEGHSRRKEGLHYQVSLAVTHPGLARDMVRCIGSSLGLQARVTGKSITISSRLVHYLFNDFLRLGAGAHTKRIPALLSNLPKPLLAELLSAYFSGDGSVERGRLHVTASSANRLLLRDIGDLLARFGIAHRYSSALRPAGGAVKTFLERKGRPLKNFQSYRLSIRSSDAAHFMRVIGFVHPRKSMLGRAALRQERASRWRPAGQDLLLDRIAEVRHVESQSPWLYDLEVDEAHNFLANDLTVTSNCDGDEDGLMLLLDAFVNFSRAYIPDRRGGLMDLPLVLTLRIDPREIDKEAHNLDVLWRYPLAFYEATERHAAAKDVAATMGLVEGRLGKPEMYEGFGMTHDTSTILGAPTESSYKTLGSMLEKMEKQLALAERIRAVDAADVVGRVLSTHLLPDILGNLKAFAKQKVRCTKCNAKYRRVPLAGSCTAMPNGRDICGNPLTLTVPQAGVRKYLDLSLRLVQRYPVDAYIRERVKLAQRFVDESFAPERFKTPSLSDFA